MTLKDYKRAESILKPYCESIDVSSYLPPAVDALLTCMTRLNRPREPMIAFAKAMKEKLKFHPTASRIDNIIFRLERGIAE